MPARIYDSSFGRRSSIGLDKFEVRYGARQYTPEPRLQRPSPPDIRVEPEHDLEAQRLLCALREQQTKFKEPSKKLLNRFKSQSRKSRLDDRTSWRFTPHELDTALSTSLQQCGDPRVAQALVNKGARINSIRDETSKGLVRSGNIKHCNYDLNLVNLCCSTDGGATAEELSSCLELALYQRQVQLATLLLSYGAVPGDFLNVLQRCLESGDTSILKLLLRSREGVPATMLSTVLHDAVRLNSLEIVDILLAHGADPNITPASAFNTAVQNGNLEIAVALLAGHNRVSPDLCTWAISTALKIPDLETRENFLELLMCGGANRTDANLKKCVVTSVEQSQFSTVRLLVSLGVASDHNDGEALKEAVARGDIELLDILLQGSPNAQSLESSFPHAWYLHGEKRYAAVQSFLRAGVPKRAIGTGLYATIQDQPDERDSKLTEVLISYQPDINFITHSGSILDLCVKNGDAELFKRLCDLHPTLEIINSALAVAMRAGKTDEAASVEMIERLLCLGACGPTVSQALLDATVERNSHLVKKFLEHGADVNHAGSKALIIAFHGPADLYQLLVSKGSPNDSSVSALLAAAHSAEDFDTLRIGQLLRTAEFVGPVSDALYREIQSHDGRGPVVRLLLQHNASVDHKDGAALFHAVKIGRDDVVELLLQFPVSSNSLRRAFEAIQHLQAASSRKLMMKHLLAKRYQGDGLHQALIREVDGAYTENIQLLLDHGASVDYKNAASLRQAVSTGSLPLLEQLLSNGARVDSIKSAFHTARVQNWADEATRLLFFEKILAAGQPGDAGQQICDALLEALQRKCSNMQLYELLLIHKACLSCIGGQSLRTLCQWGQADILKLLLQHISPPMEVIRQALAPSLSLSPGPRLIFIAELAAKGLTGIRLNEAFIRAAQETDSKLLVLALDNGADVNAENGRGVVAAVKSADVDGLRIMSKHGINMDAKDAALLTVTNLPASIESPGVEILEIFLQLGVSPEAREAAFSRCSTSSAYLQSAGLEAAKLLLRYGISQRTLDSELLKLVGLYDQQASSPDYVSYLTSLLENGADVNSYNGDCILKVVRSGDSEILDLILSRPIQFDVVLPRLLMAGLSESYLASTVSKCFDHHQGEDRFSPEIHDNIIFHAMEQYPRGDELITLLMDNGVSPDSWRDGIIGADGGKEPLTALLWAISNVEMKISSTTILALLRKGADPNQVSSRTNTTPLMAAGRFQRSELFQMLIDHGANVNCLDASGRSVLFEASTSGNLIAVQALAAAGATPDDGSLHEAARNLYPEIMKCLISHGHRPSYRSSDHKGFTPLAELCRFATDNSNGHLRGSINWKTRLRECMGILVGQEFDPFLWFGEKSLIHCALDNARPYEIVKCLLCFDQTARTFNEEKVLFYKAGLFYSPTKYVEFGFCLGNPGEAEKSAIIDLLYNHGCRHRFFADSGDQPQGYIGLPARLQKIQEEKQDRARRLALEESDRQERRRKMKDDDEFMVQREKWKLQQEAALRRDRWEQQRNHEIEETQHKLKLQQSMHLATMAQRHELLEAEKAAIVARQTIEMNHRLQMSEVDKANRIDERKMIDYRQQAMTHEIARREEANKRAEAAERKMLTDRDQIHAQSHSREMSVLKERQITMEHARRTASLGASGPAARQSSMLLTSPD